MEHQTLFQMPRKTCKTTDFQMENRDFEPRGGEDSEF